MNQQRNRRGDGIGLEFTLTTIRGVVLDGDVPGRLVAAAEIRIESLGDDRSVVDALVRVRAELGGAEVATRVAMFPPGSALHRFDVTGRSGPELNTLRHSIERHQAISSTVLIDDGPRRWLLALRWDEELVIRVEELVERAGFIDVAIDPSPVALARALPSGTTFARRDAALDEAFDVVIDGIPIAACSIETIGRQPPGLSISSTDVSTAVFDELVDPVAIVAEIERAFDQHSIEHEWALQLTGQSMGLPAERFADPSSAETYPPFPEPDIRAPTRQCVALGAALGAAGLAGRIRPIDITAPVVATAGMPERPWAIERVSALPPKVAPRPVTPTKRLIGRILPRRRRKD